MLSSRATQLLAELDHLLADLNKSTNLIALELHKGPDANVNLVVFECAKIQQITVEYRKYIDRVAKGPDGPIDNNGFTAQPATRLWSELLEQTYQTRALFSLWPAIQNRLRQQLHAQPQKLYPTLPLSHTAEFQHGVLQDAVFNTLHGVLNQSHQSEDAIDSGSYADIPLQQSIFIRDIHAAWRVTLAQRLGRPARFLDVGCGGGLKVLSARQCFSCAEGLEFDSGYVKVAHELLNNAGLSSSMVFQGNALTFDRYSDYDVIYLFQPIKDEELLRQLEERVVATSRPGTLLIAPYRDFEQHYEKLDCCHIAGHIYVTQTESNAANNIRTQAEQIGVWVSEPMSASRTLWDPISHALSSNGFG